MKSPRFEFKTELSPEEVQLLSEKADQSSSVSSNQPQSTALGAFIFDPDSLGNEHPTLIGGVYGDLHDSWLYIDLLWVDAKWRGQRFGVRLMQVIEQAAVANGVNRAFLGTSTFQAPQFYEQLGYSIIGELPAAIPDNSLYLLVRESLTPYDLPPETEIIIQNPADTDLVKQLGGHLSSYNQIHLGEIERKIIGGLYLYDDSDVLVGGGIGWNYGLWFGIQSLWVNQAWQDQGLEVQIIQRLEAEVSEQGSFNGFSQTSNPRVAECYREAGYREVATMSDFPAIGQSMWAWTKKIG